LLSTEEPAGQVVQVALASIDVVPAGHTEHEVAFAAENCPAGQLVHEADSTEEEVPAGHPRQVLFAAKRPAEQLLQLELPGSETLPLAHGEHEVAPIPENDPPPHIWHCPSTR
jgi:hypothetical protein